MPESGPGRDESLSGLCFLKNPVFGGTIMRIDQQGVAHRTERGSQRRGSGSLQATLAFLFGSVLLLSTVVAVQQALGDESSAPPASMRSSVPAAVDHRKLASSLRSELRALDRRHKNEIADLRASHQVRRRQFETDGRQRRRECFKGATRGSEKRDCVQEFLAGRKALLGSFKDELARRREEQAIRRKSLQEEHALRLRALRSEPAPPK